MYNLYRGLDIVHLYAIVSIRRDVRRADIPAPDGPR